MNSKTALVTGAGIRLGKAIALYLAEMGYNIALHYSSSKEEAAETSKLIRDLGVQCELFEFNFNKNPDIESLIPQVLKHFPDFNLLVNSASVYDQATMLETDKKLLDLQFEVNFKAPYLLTKSFAIHCKKGNIINIIDNKIEFNQYQYSAYLLSKKALAELTKLASIELAPNIRVNAIAPGVTLPAEERNSDYIQWRVQNIPLKKQGEIANINLALKYIIENRFITGQILIVDGGESLTNVGFHAGVH